MYYRTLQTALVVLCFRISWQLVLISTTSPNVNPFSLIDPLESQFWIAGLTFGAYVQDSKLTREAKITYCYVVDRKIYIAGSYVDGDRKIRKSCSVKVLDIETETWDHVPVPSCKYFNKESACIDRKFHVVTDEELVAYDPEEGRWSTVDRGYSILVSDSYCGIGNVLYCGPNGWLKWYDSEARRWRELKGLVGLTKIPTPKSASCGIIRLADYGGKLAFLCEETEEPLYYYLTEKKMIWCAVIALERRTDCEIWEEVEWFDRVLDVPRSSWRSWKALAATI